MIFKIFFALIFASSLFVACNPSPQAYSFFVAGHVYGSPYDTLPGLNPPFVEDFNFIQSLENMKFGVFTGDIVYRSTDKHWDVVDEEVKQLGVPIYFAVGNHDEGHKSPYRDRYGLTYQKFEQEGDLFLILNPGLGGWNIWGEQMDFLKSALVQADRYRHIFVFFHQVLWWSSDGEYKNLRINSLDGRAPNINFWTEVAPLFRATNRPVYLFAGDVGSSKEKTTLFYDRYENISLLASGMGNLTNDNYLIINVDEHKNVSLSIRWLRLKRTYTIDQNKDGFEF